MQEQGWRLKLLQAAEIIETGGLCKQQLHNGTARCAHGALNEAFFGVPCPDQWSSGDLPPAYKKATEALVNTVGPGGCQHFNRWGWNVAGWNNCSTRTAEEVMVAMRKAAMMEVVEVLA